MKDDFTFNDFVKNIIRRCGYGYFDNYFDSNVNRNGRYYDPRTAYSAFKEYQKEKEEEKVWLDEYMKRDVLDMHVGDIVWIHVPCYTLNEGVKFVVKNLFPQQVYGFVEIELYEPSDDLDAFRKESNEYLSDYEINVIQTRELDVIDLDIINGNKTQMDRLILYKLKLEERNFS